MVILTEWFLAMKVRYKIECICFNHANLTMASRNDAPVTKKENAQGDIEIMMKLLLNSAEMCEA